MSRYTIGVEEEYQIIDPHSGELTSLPTCAGMPCLSTRQGVALKRELHTCAVEVDTGICSSASEVQERLLQRRSAMAEWCQQMGLGFIAGSTHPFGDWQNTETTQSARYLELVDMLQDVGRGNLIFGLHVHVAVENPQRFIPILNHACAYLPHLLALSCSSPFWLGRATGLMSSRTAVFSRVPRTGIPPLFASQREYENFVEKLVTTGCIEDATRIWWDLRPHARFPTLEFRICDMPSRIADAVTIAALTQAIVAKLDRLLDAGQVLSSPRRAFVLENKWRAARYGSRARLVDFELGSERKPAEYIDDMLQFVDDVVDELGSRDQVERARAMMRNGNSADRQLEAYNKANGDVLAVVKQMQNETVEGL